MDNDHLVLYGSIILGLFVIVASVWVILMPPTGDEAQGCGLLLIGFVMLAFVYVIMQMKRKNQA